MMKRRGFIQLSAFAAATISLPLLHSCTSNRKEPAFSRPAFLSRFFDEDMIKETGKAYLQKMPDENDEEKLIQLLADNSSIAQSSDVKEIHEWLDGKIRQEFETGRTVMVKGWVLALTEARQCALFSLVRG